MASVIGEEALAFPTNLDFVIWNWFFGYNNITIHP
jgi:hypothetical protein